MNMTAFAGSRRTEKDWAGYQQQMGMIMSSKWTGYEYTNGNKGTVEC